MIRLNIMTVAAVFGLLGMIQVQAAPQQMNVAVLQGLDRVTARISTFEAPVGTAVSFGSLKIVASTCFKSPPEEPPESAAFLQIDDEQPDRQVRRVFSGWMYASSPGVSAMEHPIYDVWVIDCRDQTEENGG